MLVEWRLGRQVGSGGRLDEPALDERGDADEGEEGDDDRVAEGRRPVVRSRLALPFGQPVLETERPVDEDRDGEDGRDQQEVVGTTRTAPKDAAAASPGRITPSSGASRIRPSPR